MGLATIRQGDIAGSQRQMCERFTRVDIPDEHLDKRYGPQVPRDRQTMVGAWGAWGLHAAGVDHDTTALWGQGLDGSHGEHPPQQRVDPWPTGS
jgi:hypothetical protein